MTLDWRRQKAVVLESDDWGLCAWSADEEAHRALAATPSFRDAVGRRYGRSTLERAEDVHALCAVLEEHRDANGITPVWQANTVMAAPDFAGIAGAASIPEQIPLVFLPDLPTRWTRPGLWDAVRSAVERGTWWPELHGLHHIPASAWLAALRRGDADARLALEHDCLVCRATQAGSEYGPDEPEPRRRDQLVQAQRHFERAFGRAAVSLCPPDYGWDARLEPQMHALGLRVLQGWVEQAGLSWLGRRLRRRRWPRGNGPLFAMPARIAFEPRGDASPEAPLGAHRTLARVRAAWRAGRPAVVSTHRLNYAHLDGRWPDAGRAQLRTLLAALVDVGATFLTDSEVLGLERKGWSLRPIGARRGLLRVRDAGRVPPRLPLGAGEASGDVAGAGPGDYVVEWREGA